MNEAISVRAITTFVPEAEPAAAVAAAEAQDAMRRRRTSLEYIYGGILKQYQRHVVKSDREVLEGWALAGERLGVSSIPVERSATLSEMAVRVSRTIADEAFPFTAIIFCHMINDQEFSVSVACRLQCEISPQAFAFAVSQQQGASSISAISIACALLDHEPGVDHVLIVCADKWFSPFTRCAGTWAIHGDAAAALAISRGKGHRIVASANRSTVPLEPVISDKERRAATGILARAAVDAIRDALADGGVSIHDIGRLYLSAMNEELHDEIYRILGISSHPYRRRAYLGSSDPLVLLKSALEEGSKGDLILLCAVGASGHAGCLLLEQGHPHA